MEKQERSNYTVTKNNYMEVIRSIIAKRIELLKDSSFEIKNATVDSEIESEKETSKFGENHQDNNEWVEAVADFFNGDRRTFLDMDDWVFGIFSFEFYCYAKDAEKLSTRLFSSYEETQKSEDESQEERAFINKHFGGSPAKYIMAGGAPYMKRWKKENSRINLKDYTD